MSRNSTLIAALVVLLAFVAWGCSGSNDADDAAAAAQVDAQKHLSTSGFRLDSASFQEKVRPYVRMPNDSTCYGGNTSPALTWSDAPVGTVSLALIAEDVDHHTGDYVHWVLYNIPPGATELPEGISTSTEVLPDGTTQGTNDKRAIGYFGPCPPRSIIHKWDMTKKIEPPHRYYFRLYALDTELSLGPGAKDEELMSAIEGHILAQANTMGKFTRPLEELGTSEFKDASKATAEAGASPTPGAN